jgi:hypothetical protein
MRRRDRGKGWDVHTAQGSHLRQENEKAAVYDNQLQKEAKR